MCKQHHLSPGRRAKDAKEHHQRPPRASTRRPGTVTRTLPRKRASGSATPFWYFDARTNASTAPLALWFDGGPGSSSMIGLLQENGPCRITNDSSSVKLNPYSWNNEVNMLFIDQPIGAGFSHGPESVGTSQEAADVWTFLQIFLADSKFSHLAANGLAIWTESCVGCSSSCFKSLRHILPDTAATSDPYLSRPALPQEPIST
ncbi:carboxypeptidase D [Mycena leptocephala]|nr:carboxypeptidase D [Mycena leptocephala]